MNAGRVIGSGTCEAQKRFEGFKGEQNFSGLEESYFVLYIENAKIITQIYPLDIGVRRSNQQQIMIITYDKCTLFVNNSIKKV